MSTETYLLLILSLSCLGCATFHRDPVSENVVRARQMSLQGTEAMHRGRIDEAESLFVEAIATCPADERAHQHYAEILWNHGAHHEAVEHMDQAVRLSGGDPKLLTQLGEMYLQIGDPERAWSHAERAIAGQRENAAAWALRADVLHQQGDLQQAMVSYHRALSYQPRFARVQFALAEIYLQRNRPRRALSTLESLASNHPPDRVPLRTLFLRGIALKRLERYADAAEVFSVASTQSGEQLSFDLLYHLAESQWLAGDSVNARLAMQAAYALEPHHPALAELRERFQESTELAGGTGGATIGPR